MTDPFQDDSPADLLAKVQEGVKCERCEGRGWHHHWYAMDEMGREDCPTCLGKGLAPLSDSDLDALAACVCEGEWMRWNPEESDIFCWELWRAGRWYAVRLYGSFRYTISPDAAMGLQVKYQLSTYPWKKGWLVRPKRTHADLIARNNPGHWNASLCRAITTAALIAALTEAMEGGGDAGD